jgi:hypothetical protein
MLKPSASERLPEFRAYEDLVAFCLAAREQRDDASWIIGDALAEYIRPAPNGGRPPAWAEGRTVAAVARDLGIAASTASGLMHNARFWPPRQRADFPPQVSWYRASEARRRCGWRPTAGDPTPEQRALAWRFIGEYAEETPAPARQPRPLAEALDAEHARLMRLAEQAGPGAIADALKRACYYVQAARARAEESGRC